MIIVHPDQIVLFEQRGEMGGKIAVDAEIGAVFAADDPHLGRKTVKQRPQGPVTKTDVKIVHLFL